MTSSTSASSPRSSRATDIRSILSSSSLFDLFDLARYQSSSRRPALHLDRAGGEVHAQVDESSSRRGRLVYVDRIVRTLVPLAAPRSAAGATWFGWMLTRDSGARACRKDWHFDTSTAGTSIGTNVDFEQRSPSPRRGLARTLRNVSFSGPSTAAAAIGQVLSADHLPAPATLRAHRRGSTGLARDLHLHAEQRVGRHLQPRDRYDPARISDSRGPARPPRRPSRWCRRTCMAYAVPRNRPSPWSSRSAARRRYRSVFSVSPADLRIAADDHAGIISVPPQKLPLTLNVAVRRDQVAGDVGHVEEVGPLNVKSKGFSASSLIAVMLVMERSRRSRGPGAYALATFAPLVKESATWPFGAAGPGRSRPSPLLAAAAAGHRDLGCPTVGSVGWLPLRGEHLRRRPHAEGGTRGARRRRGDDVRELPEM